MGTSSIHRIDDTASAPNRARRGHPTLSIVLVCGGHAWPPRPVVSRMASTLRELGAELIPVTSGAPVPAHVQEALEDACVTPCIAPDGSSRAASVDLGMATAQGDIVLVRDLDRIGEAAWLRPVARLLGADEAIHMVNWQGWQGLLSDEAPEALEVGVPN